MKWLIAVLALAGTQAQDDEKKEEGLPLEVAETQPPLNAYPFKDTLLL